MAVNINHIEGKINPINDNVLVTDMYFGEQKTSGGLIITNDDGNVRGIYPRWAKVYAKGPKNTDPFKVGDWILIEHGRWTRGFNMKEENTEIEVRMVETSSILMYSEERPSDVLFGGSSISDFQSDKISADSFVRG
jgi:co-chaperonin GroES (HSP10)